ncbi:unnamed protein product [Cunninghamella blakesleeana]
MEAKQQLTPVKLEDGPTGIDLYARFALAGALGCGVTHASMTPVDVVKTRIQISPEIYNRGLITGFRQVVAKEGASALLTGFGPTALGYSLQGALKFGGYEFWKKQSIELVGKDKAVEYRVPIYLISSGIAEFFASVALCPLEATRIRLVSQPDFANGLVSGFTKILKNEGVLRGFYSGFGPILFKQIPYTMAKFGVFEVAEETILSILGQEKEELKPMMKTIVSLDAGLVAGVAAALVSQPADTLLSKINKEKGAEGQSVTSRLVTLSKDLGVKGLFTGTGPRLVMVSVLTMLQFGIYGEAKRLLGATNSVEIAKVKKVE